MNKAVDAFRTIGEVADDLDVPKHVLRFWEGKFPQIRPMKRGGGRRYYRPEDMELLRGIRHLLHAEGYTIKGVQKILREQGIEQVKALARASLAPAGGAASKRASRKQATAATGALAVEKGGATALLRDGQGRETQARLQKISPAHDVKGPTLQVIKDAIKALEHCRTLLAPVHIQQQSKQQAAEPKRARAGGRT